MEYKVLKEEADEKWQEKVTGKWSLDGEIDRCYVWKWVIESRNSKPWELLEKIYEFMKQFVLDGRNLLESFLESVDRREGGLLWH